MLYILILRFLYTRREHKFWAEWHYICDSWCIYAEILRLFKYQYNYHVHFPNRHAPEGRARYLRGGGVNQSIAATTEANPRINEARNAVVLDDIAEKATGKTLSSTSLSFISLSTNTLFVAFTVIWFEWHSHNALTGWLLSQSVKVNSLLEIQLNPLHIWHDRRLISPGQTFCPLFSERFST